jgi:hypothetical protein
MPHLKYQVKKRFIRLISRHYRGFGIDSPYVYHLVREVIEAKMHYYPFKKLDRLRRNLISDLKAKALSKSWNEEQNLGIQAEIDRLNDCTHKYRFLFRLVNFTKPNTLAIIGDDSGLLLSYMAKVDSRRDLLCLGTRSFFLDFSQSILKEHGISNVKYSDFSLINKKTFDFIHISRSVDSKVLIEFENNLEKLLNKESYLVIENINRDEKMIQLWDRLKKMDRFNVSLDLFEVGVLIVRDGLKKQDYNLSSSSYK